MKLITAIIQPDRLEYVRNALSDIGLAGMTVSDALGAGRQKTRTEVYRGAKHPVTLLPKIRLEVLANDELVDTALSAIVAGARTGHVGDGKIWVTTVDQVIRVRTGESGDAAVEYTHPA